MKNNTDIIVTFAKLWGIYTADNRAKKSVYRELESYDSEELTDLLAGWAEEYIEGGYDDTCDFFEKKMSSLISSFIQSAILASYPVLIGTAATVTRELHSVQEVADFIMEQGMNADVCITLPDGRFFLDTLRIYVNRGADQDYKAEVMKALLPMQQKLARDFEEKEKNKEKGNDIKES